MRAKPQPQPHCAPHLRPIKLPFAIPHHCSDLRQNSSRQDQTKLQSGNHLVVTRTKSTIPSTGRQSLSHLTILSRRYTAQVERSQCTDVVRLEMRVRRAVNPIFLSIYRPVSIGIIVYPHGYTCDRLVHIGRFDTLPQIKATFPSFPTPQRPGYPWWHPSCLPRLPEAADLFR